jgi:hypothetical protein
MNVFIKSFNRPYYLDRCIHSVLLNVTQKNLSIIVLDDGTNPKYLKKIKEKYSNVEIRRSPFYEEKVSKIDNYLTNGAVIQEMEIPTQFWLSNIIENKDDYFMLLEDDIWVTEKIILDDTIDLMRLHSMCMLKLFYFDNPRLVSGKLTAVSNSINLIQPKLFTKSEFLFKWLVLGNPFKIWSILRRFNVPNTHVVNYYTIYNVAGAIFSKEYYAYLWEGFTGKVKESEQLIKALRYNNAKKAIAYGVTKKDFLNTSFSSSATNTFAHIDFNPFHYNNLLNEAWYNGELDPMSGYPNDIPDIEIEKVLKKGNHKLASIGEWQKWVNQFKEQYQNIGFSV